MNEGRGICKRSLHKWETQNMDHLPRKPGKSEKCQFSQKSDEADRVWLTDEIMHIIHLRGETNAADLLVENTLIC